MTTETCDHYLYIRPELPSDQGVQCGKPATHRQTQPSGEVNFWCARHASSRGKPPFVGKGGPPEPLAVEPEPDMSTARCRSCGEIVGTEPHDCPGLSRTA